MDRNYTIKILDVLYNTHNEILEGNFCYGLFIKLDKIPDIYINYNDKELYNRIYHQYSSYGEMKKNDLIIFLERHLIALDMAIVDNISNLFENIGIK